MAQIYVPYNPETDECTSAFKTLQEAESYLDSADNPSLESWDICMIDHPTMTQDEMILKHELIIAPTNIVN